MLGLAPTESGSVLLLDDKDWLRSAVWLSLGTDARAADDDPLPENADKRGWWADSYRAQRIGSRLWLLAREKQLPETLRRAEEYAREALQWMTDKDVAQSVRVAGRWDGAGRLLLDVEIDRPRGEKRRYSYLWSARNAV